jgi:hypothetical protein
MFDSHVYSFLETASVNSITSQAGLMPVTEQARIGFRSAAQIRIE